MPRMSPIELEDYRRKRGERTKAVERSERNERRREREIQREIGQYLMRHGIPHVVSRMDKATTTKPGTPDFIVAHRGMAYAFEVKTRSGKTTREQDAMLSLWGGHAAWSGVVRSLQELIDILLETSVVHLGETYAIEEGHE